MRWRGVGLVAVGLVLVGAGVVFVFGRRSTPSGLNPAAITAGQTLSGNHCQGEGVPHQLSVSPMKPEDFTHIVPYGAVVGGHVTPIDHQYFAPADYRSLLDAYGVVAMDDATLVDIGRRTNTVHPATEYRLVFAVSCTFLYYYDLVTSLAPDIKAEYDAHGHDGYWSGAFPVTAGQPIGRIGGRTLDFAVWDTTQPLTGFIVPEHYAAEPWKLYTADPLDYATPELRDFLLSRYVRTTPPISGKIDHDIDGKLIGNWFLEGSEGYGPTKGHDEQAFTKHLAIVPDVYDPTRFLVSVGALYAAVGPEAQMQYTVPANQPDPATVGVETGLVHYDLAHSEYLKPDGSRWDRMSFTKGVRVSTEGAAIDGCALAQLLEPRRLKFEVILGGGCADELTFTDAATIYAR